MPSKLEQSYDGGRRMTYNCSNCKEGIYISQQEHFHLIIEGASEEAEQFDFCSFICLKRWVE
jgi:hypothetical protein